MRIEIRCARCDSAFLVDESSIEGELICPGCSTPMRPDISGPASAPPPAAAARKREGGSDEVVCPRCKLHFVPRRSAGPTEQDQRRTVLVVEDLEYFREIAVDALASRYEVKTAINVKEARAALAGGGIDLMILDLTLDGGEHGVELLRSMTFKPCPILIYTAQDESEMYGAPWDELREIGADDLVMKGMNVGESLLRKTAALLGDALDEED